MLLKKQIIGHRIKSAGLTAALGLTVFGLAQAAVEWEDVPLTEHTYAEAGAEFREGVYEIPVPAWSALEFKLAIDEGESIVYEWRTDDEAPQGLTAEFHGHTEPGEDGKGTVMFYKIHEEGEESGVLTAPFTGIHGWYLNNESDEDRLVTLRVAGFYEETEQ